MPPRKNSQPDELYQFLNLTMSQLQDGRLLSLNLVSFDPTTVIAQQPSPTLFLTPSFFNFTSQEEAFREFCPSTSLDLIPSFLNRASGGNNAAVNNTNQPNPILPSQLSALRLEEVFKAITDEPVPELETTLSQALRNLMDNQSFNLDTQAGSGALRRTGSYGRAACSAGGGGAKSTSTGGHSLQINAGTKPLPGPFESSAGTLDYNGGGSGRNNNNGDRKGRAAASGGGDEDDLPVPSRQQAAAARAARQRKRKEPEDGKDTGNGDNDGNGVVEETADEKAKKARERAKKNRESAARSRAKRLEYQTALEKQVEELKKENEKLREKLLKPGSVIGLGKGGEIMLRRTRTNPI
jgi:hypothetical protein